MKESIHKFNPDSEFYIEERCWITEQSNSESDPDLSIAQARVEPGITTRWHSLRGTLERYVIISGKGIMEVGDLAAQEVSTGDVVVIPPDIRQRITNTGDDDLLFLCICTPRFDDSVYQDLEDEEE